MNYKDQLEDIKRFVKDSTVVVHCADSGIDVYKLESGKIGISVSICLLRHSGKTLSKKMETLYGAVDKLLAEYNLAESFVGTDSYYDEIVFDIYTTPDLVEEAVKTACDIVKNVIKLYTPEYGYSVRF